jgi:hypothetical protein
MHVLFIRIYKCVLYIYIYVYNIYICILYIYMHIIYSYNSNIALIMNDHLRYGNSLLFSSLLLQ